MKKSQLKLLAAGLILLAHPIFSQDVKLANVALGMNEAEVKAALVSSAPYYINQDSDSPDLHYLVAAAEAESFTFTLIDGRVAAFSVTHILPPGQQPTVAILRNLITKLTWIPAEIKKGDTLWLSDATGAPLPGSS